MRRLAGRLLMTLLLAGLALLFVFLCLPLHHTETHAVQGTLALPEALDGVFDLEGEWQALPGALAAPADFDTQGGDAQTAVLPATWPQNGQPLLGCATYRLRVTTGDERLLLLFVPEVPTAYRLYVNGQMLAGAGTVSETDSKALVENRLLPVQAQNGRLEIVLQVANHQFFYGGPAYPLALGEHGAVLAWFLRTRLLCLFVMGCIAFMGIYHQILFWFRRREGIYQAFAALCYLCCLRFLLETNGINDFFQVLPYNIHGIRLYINLACLHAFVIMGVSLWVFVPGLLGRWRRPMLVYAGVTMLLCLVLPYSSPAVLAIYGVSLALSMFFMLAAAVVAFVRGPRDYLHAMFLAAAAAYVVLGLLPKVLRFDHLLYMPGLISNLFMLVCQSVLLAQRYAAALQTSEDTNLNLEAMVASRTQKLSAANAAMRELVSNISHDVKTPLSVLSVNLEQLYEGEDTLAAAERLRLTRTAYAKNLDLQRLVQNLLEVSRIDVGQNQYSLEAVPLAEVMLGVQQKYADQLEAAGVQFEVEYQGTAGLWADRLRLWSVFDNVIYNAVRYVPEGGAITVRAGPAEGGGTLVTVDDNGCGIAPQHLPHIFERFYKASPQRNAAKGESGLGLYIVKSTMQGMGGDVTAQSTPGAGTRISLFFAAGPAAPGTARPAEAPAEASADAPSKT